MVNARPLAHPGLASQLPTCLLALLAFPSPGLSTTCVLLPWQS